MKTGLSRLGHKQTLAWLLLACALGAVAAASADPAEEPARAMIHPAEWPRVSPALPPDPVLERRLTELLSAMTLEQKVGQLIQADISSITPEDLCHYPLGAILNGGNSSPGNDALASPGKWLALADRFYDASADPACGKVPVLWGTDAVHGDNKIVGATIFPHNIGLGAAHDPKLLARIGEITALEIRTTGLDWTFGPTLAVVRDARWGRTYESYSDDPTLVREYADALVTGLQGHPGTRSFLDSSHVIATAKHFLGDGGTGGKDQGDNLSSEGELRDIDGAGYPPAISAGVQSVMASFSSWHGAKMTGNASLLTGVLKERMGFDGFLVGDWNAHAQLPGCTASSCAAAVNAGIDMLMAPESWKALYTNTLAQARTGEISAARLDDAVRRILRVKLRAHLLEEGRPSARPQAGHFELLGSPRHRAVARQAVRESLVLLKNSHHLLPLAPHATVLVAGEGADSIPRQCGGWTLTWQGTGTTNRDFPHGQSIQAGIQDAVNAAGGHVELSLEAATRRPDVAIVVFGESPYAEFQGDRPTLEYSPGQKSDLALLKRLHADGIPVVAVFLSGRPLWVNPEINAADAFVAAWLPGSEGGGIADVLFRTSGRAVRYDFHGKLSFPWPASPYPASRGAVAPPLFPVGYGLRYADDGDLKPLPEDLGRPAAPQVDARLFFGAGRPGAGWRWTASEGSVVQDLPQGVGTSSGGHLVLSATDKSAQEDARLARFSGPARLALSGPTPIDWQREANGQLALTLDYRVEHPATAAVDLEVGCGPGCSGKVPITQQLTAGGGEWRHLAVPLACFSRAGADLARVTSPFALATAGELAVSLANIQLESGPQLSCP
jgi:beta-glucosidase